MAGLYEGGNESSSSVKAINNPEGPRPTNRLLPSRPHSEAEVDDHPTRMEEEKKELVGSWLRRNCLLKDALKGMVNRRRVRCRRRYQMIDDIKIYGSYEETKKKAENRKDWRKLAAPILSVCVSLLQLNQKQILPPFRPPLESELDLDNFDPQFTLEPVQLTPDDTLALHLVGPQLEQKQVAPPYKPRLESDRDLANFPPEFTDEPVHLTPDDTLSSLFKAAIDVCRSLTLAKQESQERLDVRQSPELCRRIKAYLHKQRSTSARAPWERESHVYRSPKRR
ncbi:hypothetical protein ANN_05011 [Periplaneta americana]|uniref:AGC-kinase C-terminal domain-containing protein n=1 Tax=Periplaneta americana TaxID=6978 RepID=A0ABQ8TBN7_PERAM|nr:hypothetical protein ANN_05011 [Periplaneta americana]